MSCFSWGSLDLDVVGRKQTMFWFRVSVVSEEQGRGMYRGARDGVYSSPSSNGMSSTSCVAVWRGKVGDAKGP